MSSYSFEEHHAKQYGTDAAIFLNHVGFFVKKNQAEERNIYKGCAWTFNTLDQYARIFPWMSRDSVNRVIVKLRKAGEIRLAHGIDGNKFDRKNWLTIPAMFDIAESPDVHIAESPDVHIAESPDVIIGLQVEPSETAGSTSAHDTREDEKQDEKIVALDSDLDEEQKDAKQDAATEKQIGYIKELAGKKEMPENTAREIARFALLPPGGRAKKKASELITALEVLPDKSNIITAILYNPTDSWIQKIPRDTFEYIRSTLHNHHRGPQAIRPAVFDIDGKEYHLVAIDAYDPDKKAENNGPDTDRGKMPPVTPGTDAAYAVDALVYATDVTPKP